MNMCGLGSGVIKFNGLNYADWYEQIQFQLGVFDLDCHSYGWDAPSH